MKLRKFASKCYLFCDKYLGDSKGIEIAEDPHLGRPCLSNMVTKIEQVETLILVRHRPRTQAVLEINFP